MITYEKLVNGLFIAPILQLVSFIDYFIDLMQIQSFLVTLNSLILSPITKKSETNKPLTTSSSLNLRLVDERDPRSAYRVHSLEHSDSLVVCDDLQANIYAEFVSAVRRMPTHSTLGTRRVLRRIEASTTKDGKTKTESTISSSPQSPPALRKLLLATTYEWLTYTQIERICEQLSQGLLRLGCLHSGEHVVNSNLFFLIN